MSSANWTGEQRAKQLPEHSQGVPKHPDSNHSHPVPPCLQTNPDSTIPQSVPTAALLKKQNKIK